MASNTEPEIRDEDHRPSGQDASWHPFAVISDQKACLQDDVRMVLAHPLIPDGIAVGGFLYDVDTGLLEQLC